MAKRAKHSDAVMTGILVTRFKMGLLGVEELEEMATDEAGEERCSATWKVLEAVKDSPEVQRREGTPGGGTVPCI